MKIASASLQMASAHAASQRHAIDESLRLWVGKPGADSGRGGTGQGSPSPAGGVRISDAGKAAQSHEAESIEQSRDAVDKDPKLQLVRSMVEFLTGRKIEVFDASELGAANRVAEDAAPPPAAPGGQEPAGYGLEYDYHEVYGESEETSFSASGTVRTADGREIRFQLDLAMERSYQEEARSSLRLGDAARQKDPLVLSFAGTAAQLTDTRFQFDLDADGRAERINFVGPGSGFLVLDRNRDGKVDNGRELFGPVSGDGFAELAALDDDRNGWIDENDGAYRDLRVWTKDPAGGDHLQTLAESGVGALALARVETPFDIKDDANRMQGRVRSSGVFLGEDGRAGSLQQIDLTV